MSLPINTALAAFYYPPPVVVCLTISRSLCNWSFRMLCSYLRIECLYLFLLTFAFWVGKATENVTRIGGTMLTPTASRPWVFVHQPLWEAPPVLTCNTRRRQLCQHSLYRWENPDSVWKSGRCAAVFSPYRASHQLPWLRLSLGLSVPLHRGVVRAAPSDQLWSGLFMNALPALICVVYFIKAREGCLRLGDCAALNFYWLCLHKAACYIWQKSAPSLSLSPQPPFDYPRHQSESLKTPWPFYFLGSTSCPHHRVAFSNFTVDNLTPCNPVTTSNYPPNASPHFWELQLTMPWK